MSNQPYALQPSRATDGTRGDFGLMRWLRERVRYVQAMRELNGLDRGTLDDIEIAPDQFPMLAERHARGLPPIERAQAG